MYDITNLDTEKLSQDTLLSSLIELKGATRSTPVEVDRLISPCLTRKLFLILHHQPQFGNEVLMEVLRCFNNLILQSDHMRSILCQSVFSNDIQNLFNSISNISDTELITVARLKVIFLTTALIPDVRYKLVGENNLKLLTEFVNLDNVQITEHILKICFNLTVSHEVNCSLLNETVLKSLSSEYPSLISHAINILINYKDRDLPSEILQLGDDNGQSFIDIIVKYLVSNVTTIPRDELEEATTPVFTLIIRLAKLNKPIASHVRREYILPPVKDATIKPEDEESTRGTFVRLMTSSSGTHFGQLVAEFLFTICHCSVPKMVKYTGYGNAAGMLASKGLLFCPQNENSQVLSTSSSEDDDYDSNIDKVDPITGAIRNTDQKITVGRLVNSMSDEQKEYEAMKIVNTISQLEKLGLIKPSKIENGKPVPLQHVSQLLEERNSENSK